jgi:hypothetical protein
LSSRGEGFAHEFFVAERAVNFSGIEELYAELDGVPKSEIISCLSAGGP